MKQEKVELHMCTWKQIKLQYWTVNYWIVTIGSHQPIILFVKVQSQRGDKWTHLISLTQHHACTSFSSQWPFTTRKCDCDLMALFEEGDYHTQECKVKGYGRVGGCLAWSHCGCHLAHWNHVLQCRSGAKHWSYALTDLVQRGHLTASTLCYV